MTALAPDHVLFTRMLLVDGIVGVGFPNAEVGQHAEKGGLATATGNLTGPDWAWNRRILETLSTDTLQDLYTSLKLHEVTHAHQ